MNKLLKNLENKLKDIEQDIKSLESLNSSENDVSHSIEFKEMVKEDLIFNISQVEELKKRLENDETILDLLESFRSFKFWITKSAIKQGF